MHGAKLLIFSLLISPACGPGKVITEPPPTLKPTPKKCPGPDCPPSCQASETLCEDNKDDDCDGLIDCLDSDCAQVSRCITADTDNDGLPDIWERQFDDASQLDATKLDTDNNGVADGLENPDGDDLTNAEEFLLSQTPALLGATPHPLRRDLLIELDEMSGFTLPDAVIAEVTTAFAALPQQNIDGSQGVSLLVFRDETNLPVATFDGSFSERQNYLAEHTMTLRIFPNNTAAAMVHVVVAASRTDETGRGGEVVAAEGMDAEHAGVFIYHQSISALAPACGLGPVAPVTLNEFLANTFVHELGHTLQVGHDTAQGGINYFNVMSQPTSCGELQMRFHGRGNSNTALGNTETVSEARFSLEAAGLMRFNRKLSVDTAVLNDVDM